METFDYILQVYIKLLNIPHEISTKMIREIRNHFSYPSLRSISDCFDKWQIDNEALKIVEEDFMAFTPPFLAHLRSDGGSFILVLSTKADQILYIDQYTEIRQELFHKLKDNWDGVVFTAATTELSGISKICAVEEKTITLKDIIQVAKNQEEPATYKLFRKISVFFSYFFIKLRVNPSIISIGWFIALASASWLLTIPTYTAHLVASGLILLHFILDCSDGEVARATQNTSRTGSMLEQVIHWTTNLMLIIGISLGLYNETNDDFYLFLGMFVVLSDACFHYVYIQFNFWMDSSVDYGFFHKITKTLFFVMPLNINLFVIGALTGNLFYVLVLWGLLSSLLFLVLIFLFFRKEFLLLQKN